jgi:hypothetical protein
VNNYEPLGNYSKHAVHSPESNEDCKENILKGSPLTLGSDAPVHPLQFEIQQDDENCDGHQQSPNSRYDRNISDPKLSKKSPHYDRKMKPPLQIGGRSSIPSKNRKQRSNSSTDESSESDYRLGTLSERLNSCSETTILFSNKSGNEFKMKHQKDNFQDEFQQIMSINRSASELHGLCSCMTTTDDLLKAKSLFFGISLHQASGRDYKGETILHSFSNNKVLAAIIGNPNNEDHETKDFLTLYRQPSIDQISTDQLNELVESFLVEKLLPSFFGAPIAQNNDGQIPFEAGLIDWVATCHKEMYGISPQSDTGYFSAYTNKVTDVVTNAWESTSSTLLTAMAFGKTTGLKSQHQDASENDIERGDSMSSTGSTISDSLGKSKLSPHARFCLRMLSLILDEYEKFTEGFKSIGMNRQMEKYSREIKGIQQLKNVTGPLDLCGRVVEKVASIPHLLEVIFSMNNENDLEFVLSTKIIQRVLVDKHSVGPWLTTMLQNPQRDISKRAIDYLQTVSSLCAGKQNDQKQNRKEDLNPESDHYEELIDEVSRLHNFIPSLLALEEKVIEEVSTTLIVKEVMDRMIARPFVATVVLCDAIFLFLMILGFRAAVNGMIMGDQLDNVLTWIYVVSSLSKEMH